MTGWRGLSEIQTGNVLALGFFDGLHRGHCAVLREAVKLAKHFGCQSEAITFYPHPHNVLHQRSELQYLTTYREKYALFRNHFPESTLRFLRFDRALMKCSPENFLDWLCRCFSPRGICVGQNFRYGFEAAGHIGLLQSYLTRRGVQVVIVPSLQQEDGIISSTRIRESLLAGNVQEARTLLGYPFLVSGQVRPGNRIGRSLGFPTVNLYPPSRKLFPRFGVYRGEVQGHDFVYPSLIYAGTRPTIASGGKRIIEAYLRANLDEEIYGRRILVSFHGFIRGEMVFGSLEELKSRISQDLETLEFYLHETNGMVHCNLNVNTMGVF